MPMSDLVLINGRVLTERGLQDGLAVRLSRGRIAAVGPAADLTGGAVTLRDLEGGVLLPGFIDTQVNGGGGVLFNDQPTVEGMARIGAAHRRFGTTGFLPTLISDTLDAVGTAIAATRQALAERIPGVLGLHIEGPFLNSARKGIHDASKFQVLDDMALDLLSSLKAGRTLVTLAPETTRPQMIQRLAQAGVVVSAGHTNGQYSEVRAALDHGLTGFTHLFNAMSPLTSREPGAVGAALEDHSAWCGLVVDGKHVDPVVLKLALRCRPLDRFMLVTDAMPCVGSDQTRFMLQGKPITVRGGACYDDHGTLAGSNLDMMSAVRNAMGLLDLDLVQAVAMASRNPAEFLGLGHELGRIAPGYRADLALADPDLNVIETWIDGRDSAWPATIENPGALI